MASYYELIGVAPNASPDEIKRAFRREIAKYHPDKVQHLGKEFQDIAAVKAAELTQAYKILGDRAQRAEYDELLATDGAPADEPPTPGAPPPAAPEPRGPRPTEPARPTTARVPAPEAAQPSGATVFQQERAGASDLVQRATVARFRQVLQTEFGQYEEVQLAGFQVTCIPKLAFFKMKAPPRVIGRFVPQVTGAAVNETWSLATKMKRDKDPKRDLCVFLMGPVVAAPGELAQAISENRKKPNLAGGNLIMVPINTRTWLAHVPQDAPPVVKSIVTRLKTTA